MPSGLQSLEFRYSAAYGEALRKETRLRLAAFVPSFINVCGERLRPFTVRDLINLEANRNGFVEPCTFDNDREMLAHALQFCWYCHEHYEEPQGLWSGIRSSYRKRRMIDRLKQQKAVELLEGISEYLAIAFHDAGKSSGEPSASYAHWSVYVYDLLMSGGHQFTWGEFERTPLSRLWQMVRICRKRLNPESPIANPSDAVMCRELEANK